MAINIEDFKVGGTKRKYITNTDVLPIIDAVPDDPTAEDYETKLAAALGIINKCYTMCDGTLVETPQDDDNPDEEDVQYKDAEVIVNEIKDLLSLDTFNSDLLIGTADLDQMEGEELNKLKSIAGIFGIETEDMTGRAIFDSLVEALSVESDGNNILNEDAINKLEPGDTETLATLLGVDLEGVEDTGVIKQRIIEYFTKQKLNHNILYNLGEEQLLSIAGALNIAETEDKEELKNLVTSWFDKEGSVNVDALGTLPEESLVTVAEALGLDPTKAEGEVSTEG